MLNGARQIFTVYGSDPVHAANQAHGVLYGLLMRHATMLAFIDDFWLMGVISLVMIPCMFLMKKMRPHSATPMTH
jgi:DHA2 family multidrug resistance protein